MTRLGIIGAPGRLASAVGLEAERRGWVVTLRASRTHTWMSEPPDAIVDASHVSATAATVALCRAHGAALVHAVSGLGEAELQLVRGLAVTSPVVIAPNLAAGHELQRRAVAAVAAALAGRGDGWEVTVVDRHPRTKCDAPSATARALRGACEGAGLAPLAVTSLRCGLPVADHAVVLSAAGEELTIRHDVRDLGAAARGALRAADWAVRAGPGLWHMSDAWGDRAGAGDPPLPQRLQEMIR